MIRTLTAIWVFTWFPSALHAEVRTWRSHDGSRSIRGEFVRRGDDSVWISRGDGKEVEIQFARLHPDDRKWLEANHPPASATPEETNGHSVFDVLQFGDTREMTLEKLRRSEVLECTVAEGMLARTGLNGSYRTRAKIGGKNALLFFDWADDGTLRDIQLRSDPVPATGYRESLGTCWTELSQLLTVLHGKPKVSADELPAEPPAEGAIAPTHAWTLEHGGTAQLGPARENGQVRMVVHFTSESLIRATD